MKLFIYHFFFLASALSGAVLHAQSISSYRFVPQVILGDRIDPVLFEVTINGSVTDVVFQRNGQDLPMYDDGTNGDLTPGDNRYTILFDPQPIVSGMTAADVFRPFVGYCKPRVDGTPLIRLNIFAEVMTNEIPLVPVCQMSEDLQVSPYLVNIQADGILDFSVLFQKLAAAGIPTEVDFLNFITLPSQPMNRYHSALQNQVQGIGKPIFTSGILNDPNVPDNLLGYNVFPFSSIFDGANPGALHELGHQWMSYAGDTFSSCVHWAASDMAKAIMGYDFGSSLNCQGLNFPYDIVPVANSNLYSLSYDGDYIKIFHNLELYFMGLLPADSVQSFLVLDNQDEVIQGSINGTLGTYQGPATTYTVQDVIDLLGPRVPGSATAPKKFKILTVMFSPELITQNEMSFYDYFAKRGDAQELLPYKSGFATGTAAPFYVASRGKGELDSSVYLDFDNDLDLPGENIAPGVYRAINTLQASGSLAIATTTTFKAGEAVVFTPGFNAIAGSEMRAFIESCPSPVSTLASISEDQAFGKAPSEANEPIVPQWSTLKIYPNPSHGTSSVEYQLEKAADVEIIVTDATGKLMQEILFRQTQDAGRHHLEIHLDKFAAGLYLLKARIAHQNMVKKIVVY